VAYEKCYYNNSSASFSVTCNGYVSTEACLGRRTYPTGPVCVSVQAFIGNRYGYRPIPSNINVNVFETFERIAQELDYDKTNMLSLWWDRYVCWCFLGNSLKTKFLPCGFLSACTQKVWRSHVSWVFAHGCKEPQNFVTSLAAIAFCACVPTHFVIPKFSPRAVCVRYKRDDNTVPPSYVLQPITSQYPNYDHQDSKYKRKREADGRGWEKTSSRLAELLRKCARAAVSRNEVDHNEGKAFFKSGKVILYYSCLQQKRLVKYAKTNGQLLRASVSWLESICLHLKQHGIWAKCRKR